MACRRLIDQVNVNMNTVEVLGYPVFNDVLDSIPVTGPARVIATISPNSYGIASRTPEFREALLDADYLVLDGVYFGLGGLLLKGQRIRLNNGPAVFRYFMKRMSDVGGRVFFLGSSNETLALIRARAALEYPALAVGGFSPPYAAQFSQDEVRHMIDAVNAFGPDVLFVGMTAPKQEIWAFRNGRKTNAAVVASIGAVFDWYAGTEKEIAPIWWNLRLAWLIRTIRRPEILKRYPAIGIFFRDLLLSLLGCNRTCRK
jgi:N-acetylglucosaminyldiphosphoundecaprenol N-acetyl-beta-D-mannosaminyltransferase